MTLPTGFAIVPERGDDAASIEALLDRAFGADRLARRSYSFRAGIASEPGLGFVARDPSGGVAGTIRYWPILVLAQGAAMRRALLLGPLAVDPGLKGMGVGRALVRKSLEAARAAGHALVLLVGDPAYYGQFGFVPAAPLGFCMPGEKPERLQVLALAAGAPCAGGTIARADALALA